MGRKIGRIRDVARESGVSVATVSRAMNGNTNVKPETRQRVLEASKRLDYVPNPAARALTTKRTQTIAAIIPTIENSVYAKFVAAIEQTMSKQNYSLVLSVSNADDALELAAAEKLLAMGAEGFILSGSAHGDILIDLLARRQIPFAFTSVFDPTSDIATIGYDNSALAASAIRYLVGKGHSEIAVVHGPLVESDRTVARKMGAISADHLLNKLHFVETNLSVAGGKTAVLEVLAIQPRPTAVLCFSDVLALGIYFGLGDAGLHIPTDVSVMGFDNLDWSKETIPALTTINLPARQMGIAVAEQLMQTLENATPLASEELSGTIIERDSVRILSRQK
jgi:LacI family transcriptional regulator